MEHLNESISKSLNESAWWNDFQKNAEKVVNMSSAEMKKIVNAMGLERGMKKQFIEFAEYSGAYVESWMEDEDLASYKDWEEFLESTGYSLGEQVADEGIGDYEENATLQRLYWENFWPLAIK